ARSRSAKRGAWSAATHPPQRSPQAQAASRDPYPDPERDPRPHSPPAGPLAASIPGRSLYRAARIRAVRFALGRCGPKARRTSCPSEGRSLQQLRSAQVERRLPRDPTSADDREGSARAQARQPAFGAGPSLPVLNRQSSYALESREVRLAAAPNQSRDRNQG